MARSRAPGACVLLAPVVALFSVGCSSAEFCRPDQICDPPSRAGTGGDTAGVGSATPEPSEVEKGYLAVITAACDDMCRRLQECSVELFDSETLTCSEACLAETRNARYWDCEPSYRDMLACYTVLPDCRDSDCPAGAHAYLDCRTPPPTVDAADSCVLAFNGVCDEPRSCIAGSDTTDCSAAP